MPTIKNKTKQILCLTGADGECVKIPANDGVAIVSDELWANNSRQKCVQALVDNHTVLVIHEARARPAARPAATTAKTEEAEDWSTIHWKKAKKLIDAEEGTTQLYELLEGEERPKIKSMLEERILELEAPKEKAG